MGEFAPQPQLIAVVLNWKAAASTIRCVDALLNSTRPPDGVLIVDNASDDGSAEQFETLSGPIEVIRSPANLGYAGGNNIGIARALELGADLIFVLNNDLEVETQCIERLLQGLEQSGFALIVPKISFPGPDRRLWYAGGALDIRRAQSIHVQDDRYGLASFKEVSFGTGAAMLLRRELIEDVGFLDDTYFLYWEDADYCYRATARGYQIAYVPGATAVHDVGLGSRSQSEDHLRPGRSRIYYFYMTRNRFLFLAKHLQGKQLAFSLCYAFALTVKDLGRLILRERVDRLGKVSALIRGFSAALATMPSTKR